MQDLHQAPRHQQLKALEAARHHAQQQCHQREQHSQVPLLEQGGLQQEQESDGAGQ